ncbi:mCG146901 [Mus musculus]|nr:mCG146901 [Mus musculus]
MLAIDISHSSGSQSLPAKVNYQKKEEKKSSHT